MADISVPDTRALSPVHPSMKLVCHVCQLSEARWRVLHSRYGTEVLPLCSKCFFDSGWLAQNRKRVDLVVDAISLKTGSAILRAEDGSFLRVEDADNVLGVVVLSDRFAVLNRGPK